jgi:hypothetical protein
MINKSEVRNDLQLIEKRLIELKSADCLSKEIQKIDGIISSLQNLGSSLTLGMTSSITGRKITPKKCTFCGK